ncbi:hypothetical protein M9Y10_042106 [Tritrichomonas musculus]|uniref:Thioredoxin-like fold domain-containing protein n=1 Tax=Tritrichomonas musculus TaxID=1915356 RepID=A0ABR2K9D0_9EUKA
MIAFLACLCLSVPKRYPGVTWGRKDAVIHIEVYVDPLCPDCLAIWPTLKTVLDKYPTQVNLTLHPFNLPYHTWAYYMVRAIYALVSYDETLGKQFIDALYTGEQNQFSNSALENIGESSIPAKILNYIANKYGISEKDLETHFNDETVRSQAATGFTFAAAHAVDGTPTVFINGVMTDIDPDTSISSWVSIIDDLL